MANIRLFGLVLMVTSALLGFAALVSGTTSIRFGDTGIFGNIGVQQREVNYDEGYVPDRVGDRNSVKFISLPVAYPLIAFAGAGFALWFLPDLLQSKPLAHNASRRRRRSKGQRRYVRSVR